MVLTGRAESKPRLLAALIEAKILEARGGAMTYSLECGGGH